VSLVASSCARELERFECLYACSEDPWDYRTSAYEREKYAHTLRALPGARLGAVLELGCSIGVFTEQLAARSELVVALDFSPRAIELARERVGGLANVQLVQASFPEELPPGDWDTIVCSEILYYLDPPTFARATRWLAEQLRGGACVLAVSWRGPGLDEPLRGEDVHDVLARELARWHALDERRAHYRLDRFDGDGR